MKKERFFKNYQAFQQFQTTGTAATKKEYERRKALIKIAFFSTDAKADGVTFYNMTKEEKAKKKPRCRFLRQKIQATATGLSRRGFFRERSNLCGGKF